MNFTSLQYFEMLAHERSFTRAAQRLHITQQSLSTSIAKMEAELDCQLVVRHVPLELTYAGEVLLRYAATFREHYSSMQQEFCDISQNQRGVLRLGVTYTRGRTILPSIIPPFQKRYPAIRIDLVEDTNDALRRKLVDGDVDLAIASFPNNIPGVTLEDFYREEMVLLVSRDLFSSLYGTEADDRAKRFEQGEFAVIEDLPLLLNSIDDIGGHIERTLLKRAGIAHPRIMATSSNVETLLSLCVEEVGACFCPEILARSTLTDEQFSSLQLLRLGGMARYRIRFGYLAQTYQWSIIDAFMNVARTAMERRRDTMGMPGARSRAADALDAEDTATQQASRTR